MSNERENESERRGFRVVDRRRFTAAGDERSGPDVPTEASAPRPSVTAAGGQGGPTGAPRAVETPIPAAPPSSASAAPSQANPVGEGAAPADEEDGLPFAVFVQSLAQQAMMQLGLIPWPHHGQREMQLEQARDSIDVLSMLKSKTKGNLTAQEHQLLETILYELRMTWVEINQQLAARARDGGMPKPS